MAGVTTTSKDHLSHEMGMHTEGLRGRTQQRFFDIAEESIGFGYPDALDVDESAAAPSYGHQPGACARQRPRVPAARHGRLPPIEPARRRIGIVPARARQMLAKIVEHVHERIANLTRRPQQPRVISIGPNASTPAAEAIDEAGNPDGEPAHTTLEPRRPVRFHQQVQMILLNAELQNAKALRRSGA